MKSAIGRWIRNKLGITQLEYELQHRLRFSQSMLQFSVPDIILPDEQVLSYSRDQIAERYGVTGFNPAIHKNDLMFQHHLRKRPDNVSEALFHYYNVGMDALKKTRDLMPDPKPRKTLDFGSGYGRGSRFLPHFFPGSEVYVSEVKPTALKFQSDLFGFLPLAHNEDAASFKTSDKFDLIIAISVFSHLPETSFRNWLEVLTAHLADGGSLLFTYNQIASAEGPYKFVSQSEDEGLEWVSDRIKESEHYGSSFYSQTRMKTILAHLNLSYQIIDAFSGTQSAVICRIEAN